ncbi:MAG: outer membrane protein assembly factor BamA [Candidatus Omnitrophota bacterium]
MRKSLAFCKYFLIVLSFCPFLCFNLWAQSEAPEKTVIDVRVEGNKNLSGATIISKVRTRASVPYSEVVASDDLKRLYAFGYFDDIQIDTKEEAGGVIVIFRVKEKPIISSVAIVGSRSIRMEKLQELVNVKKGQFLNIQQLKQDIQSIQKSYEAKGFPLANIDYQMKVNGETNEADISIVISEKARYKIKDIFIKGNLAFPDKKILKLMHTRRNTLFTSGVYKKEELDLDLQKISVFYQQNGYLDVKVESEEFFGAEEKSMYLTIKIEEGKQYLVGEISVEGPRVFSDEKIKETLKMKSGRVFNKDDVRYDIAGIQGLYFDKGYITAEVDADTLLNYDTGKMDIFYSIVENELAYINKIKISGNTKTKDMVIRRQLRSYPGEVFDGQKLKRSKERLYNLGFFQEISYDTEATKDPDKRDLVVNVKEAKTGEFAFGAGFSSVERFLGFVEISQKNFDITNWHTFTGAGQYLKLKAELGTTRREYDLSFTEPWIFGWPLSFGVDCYNTLEQRSDATGRSYDEGRTGGDLRLGKEWTEFVRTNLMYKLENVDISNVPDDASQDLKNEVGKNTISSLLLELTRDSRDNIYNPSKGLVTSLTGEVAGGFFGQDKDYFKITGLVDFYKTLLEKLLLEIRVLAAGAGAYSDTGSLPIYERFYVGGTNTIRGFKERAVGPKDVSGEPIGGESTLYGTCEFSYPLFEMVKVAAFCDFGNAWEKLGELGTGGLQYSAGLGVRVKTPLGPVKLDYGYPLEVPEGEKHEGRFHFSMTRGF